MSSQEVPSGVGASHKIIRLGREGRMERPIESTRDEVQGCCKCSITELGMKLGDWIWKSRG